MRERLLQKYLEGYRYVTVISLKGTTIRNYHYHTSIKEHDKLRKWHESQGDSHDVIDFKQMFPEIVRCFECDRTMTDMEHNYGTEAYPVCIQCSELMKESTP